VICYAHAGGIYHDFFVFSFCADFHLPQKKLTWNRKKRTGAS
jgi:hypothetical protein